MRTVVRPHAPGVSGAEAGKWTGPRLGYGAVRCWLRHDHQSRYSRYSHCVGSKRGVGLSQWGEVDVVDTQKATISDGYKGHTIHHRPDCTVSPGALGD